MTTHDLLDAYDIPTKWRRVHLRWLSKRYAGGTPDTKNSEYWEGGTVPWLNSGAVNQGTITEPSGYITEIALKESSAKWIPQGALVMALAGQGKTKATVGYVDIQTTGNQSLAAIVPEEIEGKFLYWWLGSQYLTLRNLSSQDGRDGLNLEMIGSIVCPVPPKETQRRITRFLDEKTARINVLIEKKRKLVDRLAEKRQALITQAVTKGLNPDVRMKPSGISWLGDVPAHWEVKLLKYISPKVSVGIVVTPTAYYADDGVLAIRGLNVRPMGFDFSDSRNISEEGHQLHLKSELHKGDLVTVRTGDPGTTSVISAELEGTNCVDLVIIRQPLEASSRFLGWFLNSDAAKVQYALGSEGALQLHFNVETSKEVTVAVPPYEEQIQITEYIDHRLKIENNRAEKVERSVELLQEYRAALITAAVTGQIEELV